MTYSIDFRRHILLVKEEEGLSFGETSIRFRVGKSSIVRWSKKIEPQRKRNKPTITVDMERLKEDIVQYPDSYQYERAKRLGVSQSGIYWALKRLGVSYKKNPASPQSRRRKTIII